MKKTAVILFLLTGLMTAVFVACSKNDSEKSTTVKIRLTDNPVLADEINVDIQQVRVKFSDDSLQGWADLSTYAGVYDLLGLQNGMDTLLAVGTIPADEVKEIRLMLGTNNSIKVNGIVYPLNIPSGSESGLKIKVNKKMNGTLDSLLIDFDAALSIHQTGAGTYQLKPVLKIK
ncbi:MAG: DUF4382 domain-containing protein [Ferruginibacter sp.]|nr:DUF4382 domain-containing protein [Chitinophagaceae bacterium]